MDWVPDARSVSGALFPMTGRVTVEGTGVISFTLDGDWFRDEVIADTLENFTSCAIRATTLPTHRPRKG